MHDHAAATFVEHVKQFLTLLFARQWSIPPPR
jgi:hypothetical protein